MSVPTAKQRDVRGDLHLPQALRWDDIVETCPIATLLVAGAPERQIDRGRILFANAACRTLLGQADSAALAQESIYQIIDSELHEVLAGLLDDQQITATPAGGFASTHREITVKLPDSLSRLPSTSPPAEVVWALQIQSRSDGVFVAQIVPRVSPAADGQALVDRVLAEQQRFRSALLELNELAHRAEDDHHFYQRLIEQAVDVVPGAQAGSVQLHLRGTTAFRFEAAVGYDLDELQRHDLDQGDFFRDAINPTARVVRKFSVASRSPEIAQWLETAGRLSEIVVNVSVPVLANGTTVAFLALDNFEDPDAFSETSIEMTTVLGGLIGELWRRRDLEAKLRAEREALSHQAHHDELTGIANRRSLETALTTSHNTNDTGPRPRAVLFIDIDDFKGVNDRHGHEIGDALLTRVAQGLHHVVRANDTVGRWGGDEFLIVPDEMTSTTEALDFAQRVLEHFEQDVELGAELAVRVRLSIGIGWSQNGEVNKDQLVRAADEALYEAKTAGKGVARLRHVRHLPAPE